MPWLCVVACSFGWQLLGVSWIPMVPMSKVAGQPLFSVARGIWELGWDASSDRMV